MSERSKLDKISILSAIDAITQDMNASSQKIKYALDDMASLRRHIESKDWLLRTPRKRKEPGGVK